VDESTDVSNEVQLVVFVQVPNDVKILEHILFCEYLQGNATRRAVL
jgi:hypothetical protein